VSEELKVDKHGRVTVLTLNRPERRNALSMSLAYELRDAVADFSGDPDQRVMIITGAGDKAFSSGADLLEARDRMDDGVRLPMTNEQDIMGIAACEKPVIAAVNGLAVGAGLEIAICCDYRLAAEGAWFGLPEVERGFIAGIAAVTLPRLMPLGTVMQLMLTGGRLTAQDAWRLGLVQEVMPAADLMSAALEQAEKMSRISQAAIWGTKQVIRHWRNHAMDEQQRFYEQVVHRVFQSGDVAEGLAAFAEKRTPAFRMDWPPNPAEELMARKKD
jgi:enoyl-CoA hydratase/carnithine racemase